jgi:hypothetical protein
MSFELEITSQGRLDAPSAVRDPDPKPVMRARPEAAHRTRRCGARPAAETHPGWPGCSGPIR